MAVEALRDIKPPVGFPVNYFPLIVGAIIVLLGIIAFLFIYFRRRKADKIKQVSVPVKPPHQLAWEALRELQAKNLPLQGKIKQYFFELSNIVRHYIENRFEIKAAEMTTEEFLYALRNSDILSGGHKNLLKEFLQLCDIVKFARYGPDAGEVEKSFQAAERFIEETKEISQEPQLSLAK